jgi:hypothetical protein
MKSTTPKKISRRDKLVDSMAKKLADGGGVEKVITIHRRRRIKTMRYVYITIALSVVSTSITYLVMTGTIAPGLIGPAAETLVAPVKSPIDLLKEDLAAKEIGPDHYALYLKDYLIHYGALPDRYKVTECGTTSTEIYRALYDIWPQVSLRTRSNLLKMLPPLEQQMEKNRFEQPQ